MRSNESLYCLREREGEREGGRGREGRIRKEYNKRRK